MAAVKVLNSYQICKKEAHSVPVGKGIAMPATDIGIDLGTSSILVYASGKGLF